MIVEEHSASSRLLALGNWHAKLRPFLVRCLGTIMPEEISNDRIVFHLCADSPFELDSLGDAFAGLAREYESMLQENGVDPSTFPTKLFVTDVRYGSLTFEIGYPILALYGGYQILYHMADGSIVFADFYNRIRGAIRYFVTGENRPENLDRADVRNLDRFLRTISGKKGASLRITRARYEEKTKDREILTEIEFNETELANAGLTIARELGRAIDEPAVPTAKYLPEKNVPFIWYRADKDRGRAKGQTSDRGIIAKVSEKPLPVYFQSELDKRNMVLAKANPLLTVYIIDALVEYDENDNPQSYTVTDVHRTIGDVQNQIEPPNSTDR